MHVTEYVLLSLGGYVAELNCHRVDYTPYQSHYI